MNRLLQTLPLLPAFVLVGICSRTLVLPAFLTAIALFTPQKRTTTPSSAIVPMAVLGAIGYLVNQQFADLRELPIEQAGYRGMADNLASTAAALAAAAAIRRRWSKPEGGEALTLAVALLSVTLSALFLPLWMTAVALLWATSFSLATLPEARDALASWRGRLRTGVTLLMATGVATGLALLLPWTQTKVLGYLESGLAYSLSGLGDHISLDQETDIKLSDERVLRLRLETASSADLPPDHLRGFVMTRYAKGTWQSPPWSGASRASTPPERPGTMSIELATAATRLLLPLDSTDLSSSAPSVRLDGTGVPVTDRPVDRYSFRIPPGEAASTATIPIVPPQSEDLLVPANVRAELEPVARTWTSNLLTREEQLAALVRALRRDFRWSLRSRRATSSDPVVDFVLHERVGHCEYFASAMALLARTLGIPARVVTGYRVAEYNPIDRSYVVRKRNAHAWVEAWTEGRGWRTYDPTPDAEVNAKHAQSLLTALLDLARAHPTRAVVSLSALVALAAAASSLRTRWETRPIKEGEPVLPNVAALVRAMARRTRPRRPGETLLDWARDVAEVEELAVVERYGEKRWGSLTLEPAVDAEAARLLRSAREAPSGRRKKGR